MAPLLLQLALDKAFESLLCTTGQHKEMLEQVLRVFEIQPQYKLNIMKEGQELADVTSLILTKLQILLDELKPDILLVHGDTTTAFSAALAAFYKKIPVAHVEAGLRTGNLYSPFPEEVNRKIVASLATLHFCPTDSASQNLLAEGVSRNCIYVTGNTVIDALFLAREKIFGKLRVELDIGKQFSFLDGRKRLVLVTGHRRESFGKGFENICNALKIISKRYEDIEIVYPVHLNPKVAQPVYEALGNMRNVYLIEPQDYLPFVYLMQKSYLILTDSGGVQEEAPSLGVPVLVMRDTTERPEAVHSGTVKVVGTHTQSIVDEFDRLYSNNDRYMDMAQAKNPYGDGSAAKRIIGILKGFR
jgi:UDP-N-acetylglucosamine 2-epimerase (non-hydrolysing)